MATIVFGGALSHSPMMNYPLQKDHHLVSAFRDAVDELGRRLRQARPDVVVVFGPDHFRSFFYDLMPALVVGVGKVSGWGDWQTPSGPFPTYPELAKHLLRGLLDENFEPASSYDLKVDHGIVQPLQLMDLMDIALVPVVINSAGPPLPPPLRCHALGSAVARIVNRFPGDLRVAMIGSGGLSHDPKLPAAESEDPVIAWRAIYGRSAGFAVSTEREQALLQNSNTLQSRINPVWDRDLLTAFHRGSARRWAANATTEWITAQAGNGGQEVRAWLAVAGALADAPLRTLFYEPIPELITGMGVIVS